MSTTAKKLGSPFNKQWQLVLVLGALEVALSQIPNLEVRAPAGPAAEGGSQLSHPSTPRCPLQRASLLALLRCRPLHAGVLVGVRHRRDLLPHLLRHRLRSGGWPWCCAAAPCLHCGMCGFLPLPVKLCPAAAADVSLHAPPLPCP